jgi:hypothetical protein
VTDGSRQTFQDVARELTAGWASMYPAALSSGVSYWAEVAAVASSYYGDVMQGLIAVVQNPSASDAILTDLVTRFKGYLTQSGDLAERTLLDFNRRLETTARPSPPAASPIAAAGDPGALSLLQRIADLGMKEVWKAGSSTTTDLHAVTRELEQLLVALKHLQGQSRAEASGSSSA